MADRILVPFTGDGAGAAPLSWGQLELWGAMQSKHTWMPIGAVTPLPAGTTVDGVVDDLRFLMRHYPTLRTRLRLDPRGPRQLVAGSGEVPLEIVDGDGDPAGAAERVRRRYWDSGYDFTGEWPIRMAVVRHRGRLTARVWVMCHLVTDGTGAAIMTSELAGRDATGSAAAMAPLAQAGWQESPAGRRQNRLALRQWERLLRAIPARRFPEPARPVRPRYWNGTFTSRALPLALHVLAARTGTDSSAVLLALFAIALARTTGAHPVVTRLVVSNRFRQGLARTVSPIVQNGLCVLDVAGVSVEEAVVRAKRQAMTAYKHAYYHPPALDELLSRVREERGEAVDIGCFLNDRRLRPHPTGPVPTAARIREATGANSFRWDEKQDDREYDPLFVSVDDTPDGLSAVIYIDTHHLPPDTAEACLRELEAVAVRAATAA